ncbi:MULTISPECIES: class I SAM-dependent methyltransferase [Pseudomonas]|uniref:class I SAM-dependent methyltransferase n=1 Tax=Pseudomonas TaxID=286 RepID=UPI00053D657A|nr:MULTISPECIES: class I SAM-dependent methyltransferase [Pseudomonas]EKD1543000.1 class I SAM-dependent methyltransferase [Pseudomonas aeruginosa]EKD1547569.1 class I SAM-dependent methyltransferase [Pseudomonas aeruginosa]EKU6311887.1 class I SAM-dependent methyltransferase [Pseudomonas aeruginosa]EKU6313125.1 class I SAM-dependent methyltransferase [Pseudomonas aeruginosa]EKV2940007.1 class I SAM-dependent methyltransferase [Pseudomonas aeruginosa]
MPGHRITLTGEKQTLLITLYAKALDSRLDDSILHDRFAEEAVRQIDFDFSRVALGKGNERALAMRSHYFDQACRDFLGRHPEGQVLNLGCGLDSRIYRVDPPAELPWFDLDYPEVMDLRERLYPPRAGAYRALRHSVDDDGWLQGVPRERPALVLAEGLMPYLRESQVRRLVERLVDHLGSGELLFDGYGRLGIMLLRLYPPLRETGAQVHWSIDDPRDLERWHPALRFIEEVTDYDPQDVAKLPQSSRLMLPIYNGFAFLRRMGRLIRYRWPRV